MRIFQGTAAGGLNCTDTDKHNVVGTIVIAENILFSYLQFGIAFTSFIVICLKYLRKYSVDCYTLALLILYLLSFSASLIGGIIQVNDSSCEYNLAKELVYDIGLALVVLFTEIEQIIFYVYLFQANKIKIMFE
jgi:hypothetical protein